jgi:hypothetical protein
MDHGCALDQAHFSAFSSSLDGRGGEWRRRTVEGLVSGVVMGSDKALLAEASKRRRGQPPLSLAEGAAPRLGSLCSEELSSSMFGGSTGFSMAFQRFLRLKWLHPRDGGGGRCFEVVNGNS